LIDKPREGYSRTWYRGVGGVFSGVIGLFKHTFIGIFGTTQVIGESWSSIALLICWDEDYAIKHEEEVITERPKNFVEGLGFGSSSLLWGVYGGLTGLITCPIIETSRNGGLGFLKGLYSGVIGFPMKMISGTLDFMGKTSEGFKNTLRILEVKQKKGRARMPRTFYGIQRRIKNFSEDDAFIVSNVLC